MPPGPNSVNPYPDPEDAVGSAGEEAAEQDTEETEQESDQSILDYIERKKLQNKILQEIIDKLKTTK